MQICDHTDHSTGQRPLPNCVQPTRKAVSGRFNKLPIRSAAYKRTLKAEPVFADITDRPQAHSAPTSSSDNARQQCPSDPHALALHRPRRLTRQPHCNLAGLRAGRCDLLKSEK
jgi:hypothetical protein